MGDGGCSVWLLDSALSCLTGNALVIAFTSLSFLPSARIRCHMGFNRRVPLCSTPNVQTEISSITQNTSCSLVATILPEN